MVKKLFKCLLLFFIMLFIGTFIITLINYFNIMNGSIMSIMRFIIPVISLIISSYKLGKLSDKNGYLEGLKLGGIVVLIFMLFVIILDNFNWQCVFYYCILILVSVMGSMFGINRKKLEA